MEQGEKRAGSDDSESEGEGEGVGEGEKSAEGSKKLKTGKKRSKHGVQHSMVTMLGGQVGDKKDGAAGSGEDGEQEFIQMVPISQAQRNLTKEEKNQALSKVRVRGIGCYTPTWSLLLGDGVRVEEWAHLFHNAHVMPCQTPPCRSATRTTRAASSTASC